MGEEGGGGGVYEDNTELDSLYVSFERLIDWRFMTSPVHHERWSQGEPLEEILFPGISHHGRGPMGFVVGRELFREHARRLSYPRDLIRRLIGVRS